MKHFVPQNGVYVYERYLDNQSIVVFMNGTSGSAEIDTNRYVETTKGNKSAKDILSGNTIKLEGKMELQPRQIIIVELPNN